MFKSNLTASMSVFILSTGIAYANMPQTFGILEFGLEDTLFVADSANGSISAYDLPDQNRAPTEATAYNILDVDSLVAAALGTEGRIIYGDLAVHPVTREAYVSVRANVDGEPMSAVVAIAQDGSVRAIDLDGIDSTSFKIQDTADAAVTFWRDIPGSTLTVTDMDFVDDELFISGVSTGEFASTLRRVPYPFEESASSSSIEMFHAAHGQNETRAPIRAMTVVDLNGTPTVIAAYTCTPLVSIPVSQLEDGKHVTGKTIAELGYGNTPLDVILFDVADMKGNLQSYVLVVNREMDADLITTTDLQAASDSAGISKPVEYLGATAGVNTTPLPLSGVVHAADQDNQFIVTMRRDLDTGVMELVSFRKGAFLRLSDFVSEYNFPDYVYGDDEASNGIRNFQNMLKADEGFPGEIVQ